MGHWVIGPKKNTLFELDPEETKKPGMKINHLKSSETYFGDLKTLGEFQLRPSLRLSFCHVSLSVLQNLRTAGAIVTLSPCRNDQSGKTTAAINIRTHTKCKRSDSIYFAHSYSLLITQASGDALGQI